MTGAPVEAGVRAEIITDESLVSAILHGNEQAFLALASREHRAMVRYAAALLGDKWEAEAVVLRAWPAILAGLRTLDGRCSLRSWMYRTVRRCAVQRGGSASPDRPTSASAFQERGADERSRLRGRLEHLPPLERQVLLLCDVERWSAEEVCGLLGMTDRSRRRHLHEARRLLHESLHGAHPSLAER